MQTQRPETALFAIILNAEEMETLVYALRVYELTRERDRGMGVDHIGASGSDAILLRQQLEEISKPKYQRPYTGKTVGEKFRFYRNRAGISQVNLEQQVGFGLGTLSRIENDRMNPSKEVIFRFAKAINLQKHEIWDILNLENIY